LDALRNKRINMAKIKTYENDNTINANDKLIGTDFNDSDKTKNYLISALKSYILSGLDVRPYKVYTALLTQTGEDAPTAVVLENTIGNILFEYIDIGAYAISSSNLFTENKTIVLQDQQTNRNDNDTDYCIRIVYDNVDSIIINTAFLDTTEINDALLNTPIEIRVYN
jgi:hypothetical protein